MVFFAGRDLGEWGAHRKIGSGKTRVMIWAESTYAYSYGYGNIHINITVNISVYVSINLIKITFKVINIMHIYTSITSFIFLLCSCYRAEKNPKGGEPRSCVFPF